MASQAAIVHTMVGELREGLQKMLAAPEDRSLAETARGCLVDIEEMAGRPASVTRATGQVARAVDEIAGGRACDDAQTARAIDSLQDSLAELSVAIHRMP